MKRSLFWFTSLLTFCIVVSAQTPETFDLAAFQPQKGWKKQNKAGAVIFTTSNEQKGTYAMITLYESGASSGNAKSDFEGDWQELIAGQLGVKNKPEIEPAKTAESWTSGGILMISPEKSVIQSWSKKDSTGDWGKLLTTQNRPLEKVTYRFTKHYFSGIQTWSLVLQADKPAERDGAFSGGTAFDNAWIYQPPCNQCLIKLPN